MYCLLTETRSKTRRTCNDRRLLRRVNNSSSFVRDVDSAASVERGGAIVEPSIVIAG
jgi:hypothetical protein